VEIRGNRLEVGDQQVGILVISAKETVLIDNQVRLGPPQRRRPGVNRIMATELGRHVVRHLLAAGSTGGRRLNVDTGGAGEVRIGGPVAFREIATDWARSTRGAAVIEPARALARFVMVSAAEAHAARLSPASGTFLAATLRDIRAIGQGIVVAGDRAQHVRIEGNDVIGALQGIHVGLQERGKTPPLVAGQVIMNGNTVLCRVPFFWGRQRHAIYVGNVDRLTMIENHAILFERGGPEATFVDAVRIWGRLGPWLQVRGLDLTGDFRSGVVIRDTGPVKGNALHYVSDVLNIDGTRALDVPATALQDRCLP
jgi:hypothetical protein